MIGSPLPSLMMLPLPSLRYRRPGKGFLRNSSIASALRGILEDERSTSIAHALREAVSSRGSSLKMLTATSVYLTSISLCLSVEFIEEP